MVSLLAAAAVFACNLGALTAQERAQHARHTRLLVAAVAERQELPEGLRFRLGGIDLPAVAEWVRLERRCCPFFRFAIEVEADLGPTWLTLSGAPGVKEFVQAELAPPNLSR